MTKPFYLLAFIALQSASVFAEQQKIICPETIVANESMPVVAPPWHALPHLGKVEKRLESVAVFSGHPNEMASLVPDKSSRKKHLQITTWEFGLDSREQYWVACTYSNSMLLLAVPLAGGTRQCELAERVRPNGVSVGIEYVFCE